MNIILVIDFAIFLSLCTFCDKNEPKNDRGYKHWQGHWNRTAHTLKNEQSGRYRPFGWDIPTNIPYLRKDGSTLTNMMAWKLKLDPSPLFLFYDLVFARSEHVHTPIRFRELKRTVQGSSLVEVLIRYHSLTLSRLGFFTLKGLGVNLTRALLYLYLFRSSKW